MNTVLGLVAGVLTTGCWLPQLLRSWRTKSTRDISWVYLAVLTAGVTLWGVYGVLIREVAVILTNLATGMALLTLMAFKCAFDMRGRTRKNVGRPAAGDRPPAVG